MHSRVTTHSDESVVLALAPIWLFLTFHQLFHHFQVAAQVALAIENAEYKKESYDPEHQISCDHKGHNSTSLSEDNSLLEVLYPACQPFGTHA